MRPAYKRISVFLVALLIIISNISYVSADYNLEYDNNGNLIQDDKFSYEYDSFNQLIKIRDDNNLIAEYFYDQNGERIKKAEYSGRSREPVSITYYIGDFIRTVEGNKVSDSIYYYNNGQLVAKEENNKKYYYHPDYLGSTNLITDENGKMVSALSYLPFGESLSDNNERFTFTGQEQDEESNLMYYGARYYNPSSGRFIQPDSVIQDIYNPQNLNRYSYVLNNPYKYNDPSGNYWHVAVGAGIGGAIGAGVSIVSQLINNKEVNWGEVGKSAFVGGVAGAVGTASFGVGASSLGVFGSGSVSGLISGRVAKLTENVIYGNSLSEGIFDPSSMILDTGIGGLSASGGSYLSKKILPKIDIVGSGYNGILPRQNKINPEIVNEKINLILKGERPIIRVDTVEGRGSFIADGHHAYVAYKKLGFSDDKIPKDIATWRKDDYWGYAPFENMKQWKTSASSRTPFTSWKKTRYDTFNSEEVWV